MGQDHEGPWGHQGLQVSNRLPCAEGDPQDWFISRDGKQYPEDELLTRHQVSEIMDNVSGSINPLMAIDEYHDAVDKAITRSENDARTAALQRRRHAKEACITSCPVRLECLTVALDLQVPHGTWGGHYEEELAKLYKELRRRKKTRN